MVRTVPTTDSADDLSATSTAVSSSSRKSQPWLTHVRVLALACLVMVAMLQSHRWREDLVALRALVAGADVQAFGGTVSSSIETYRVEPSNGPAAFVSGEVLSVSSPLSGAGANKTVLWIIPGNPGHPVFYQALATRLSSNAAAAGRVLDAVIVGHPSHSPYVLV